MANQDRPNDADPGGKKWQKSETQQDVPAPVEVVESPNKQKAQLEPPAKKAKLKQARKRNNENHTTL